MAEATTDEITLTVNALEAEAIVYALAAVPIEHYQAVGRSGSATQARRGGLRRPDGQLHLRSL